MAGSTVRTDKFHSSASSYFMHFLIGLNENLEKRLECWQTETDQLKSVFRELGKCKTKNLLKKNDQLAVKVARVEKEMLKRVLQ